MGLELVPVGVLPRQEKKTRRLIDERKFLSCGIPSRLLYFALAFLQEVFFRHSVRMLPDLSAAR
jgi:hypothetical protein